MGMTRATFLIAAGMALALVVVAAAGIGAYRRPADHRVHPPHPPPA